MTQELALSLFSDLRSGDPSIRSSVLTRIENITWNQELIQAFSVLTQTESDPTIKLSMQLIIERVSHGAARQLDKDLLIKEFSRLAADPEADFLSFAMLLETIEPDQVPLAAVALDENHWQEYSSVILPFVLKFIRRHRLSDQIEKVEKLCHHSEPQVLSAAVEVLERLNPQKIEALLVPLLTHSNYGIRSRAVRLLYRLDQQEAVKHFESMLFSQEKDEKEAAMFHAYFFPFDKIEALLLRFMTLESNPDLLKKAGFLFQVNPDAAPPLQLIEIMEGSRGSRKEIFSDILRGVLQAQGRMLGRPVDQLLEELKSCYRNKKANELIAQCRLLWDSASAARKQAIVNKLEELVARGSVAARETLVALGITVPEFSAPKGKSAELNLAALNEAQRLLIWKAGSPGLAEYADAIESLWPKMNSEEKTLILGRIFHDQQGKLAKNLPARALKDGDPTVVATAIEVLGQYDADRIFPLLPGLINHDSTEVQSAAIKVFALYDKDQAIRLLERMLAQGEKARSSAIFHLAQFDFPAVQQLLFNCLPLEDNPENLARIEAILASNIDLEGLYRVYCVSRIVSAAHKTALENSFARLTEAWLRQSSDKSQTTLSLAQKFSERYNNEKSKESQAPAYALENIQKLRRQKVQPSVPAEVPENDNLGSFAFSAFVISGFVAWAIWLLLLSPMLPQLPSTGDKKTGPGETLISGRVEKILSHGISLKSEENGKEILLVLPEVKHGDQLKMRVRLRQQQNGPARAELLELK
ncbi:MAG: HEAT repeat domain-containing protein [Candidatus Riflebacteria bacterium]